MFYFSFVVVIGISTCLGSQVASTGIIEQVSNVSKSVCEYPEGEPIRVATASIPNPSGMRRFPRAPW